MDLINFNDENKPAQKEQYATTKVDYCPEEPILGCLDDENKDSSTFHQEHEQVANPDLDEKRQQLYQKYLEKVQSSGLSLLDQPMYPEYTEKVTYEGGWILKSLRPQELAHIDDKVWDGYFNPVYDCQGFEIVDFPRVISDTRIVPMNLDSNPEAIACTKGVDDMAINWYNDSNNTGFVVVSVDKANCNPELCTFVDSDKYIIAYEPIREYIRRGGSRISKSVKRYMSK